LRLVLDWDGTITVRDSLVQVIHEFGDPALLAELEPRVGVDPTLHEEIALEFRAITTPLDEVVSWVVENVEVRDGLHELAERERPLVISAGFHELIEPVLAWGGVRLPVVAHSATFSAAGTSVAFLERPVCPVCGEQCKRMELDRLAVGRQVAYVGDGWSDRCAAKAADVVFARASLAQHLADEGVSYVPFEDLADVREGLRSYLAPA
jgi:2-hydroxy-3-keto-5-methylthiopentenyl-1-phosphate phosphatase